MNKDTRNSHFTSLGRESNSKPLVFEAHAPRQLHNGRQNISDVWLSK